MNLYETLLIVTPEADDDGVMAVIGDLRSTIESNEGTVLQAGVWQKRQLAYAVQGKTEGIYVLIYAEGPTTLPDVLKDRMRLDEAVIRNIVVRLEDLQETEVRAAIAEQAVDSGEAEAQRLAAERRATAAAEAAAMSAAEVAEAEAAEAAEAEESAAEAAEAAESEEPAAEAADDAEAEETAAAEHDAGSAAEEAPADPTDAAPAGDEAADEPEQAADAAGEEASGEEAAPAGEEEDTTDEEEKES